MNRTRRPHINNQIIMRKIAALAILSLIILEQVFAQTKKSDFKQIFPLGEKLAA